MFSSAAHLAVHLARRTVFATVGKQARFLSVSTVSSTKHFYTESVLLSEKPNKSAKAKRSNDKKFEQSKLYPNEVEKISNFDLMEEFDLLMDDNDDKTLPVMRDLRSGKVESAAKKSEAADKMPTVQEILVGPKSVTKKSEAVDKGPPMQEVGRSDWSKSVTKKSEAADKMPTVQKILVRPESVTKKSEAVDKGPSMQEVERSDWSESVARKSEAVDYGPPMLEVGRSDWSESVTRKSGAIREVKIPGTSEIHFKDNDFDERLSDSDSESDTEDSFGGFRKRLPNFRVNLDDLKITRLDRRSKFLRDEMEKATSRKNGLVFNGEIGGIFALAKMGITPEALFVCSAEILRYYPGDLSKTALYTIPLEDMKYWVIQVRKPQIAMIGLYKEENLRRKARSSEPEMPLTIICDQMWHRVGFAQIISSVCITPPRLFITSTDCVNPWHGGVVRNSCGRGMLLNHNFDLTWEEIRENVGENDRVYVLELPPIKDHNHSWTESFCPSLPSVYLYDHSFWDGDNIALVVIGSGSKRADEELSRFFIERKASRIDVGVSKAPIGHAVFHMVFFEMRRQWLAAENRNLSKSG